MRRMKWISVFIGKYLCANWVVIHSSALHTFEKTLKTKWYWQKTKMKKDEKLECKHSSTVVVVFFFSWIMLYDPYGGYVWIPSPCYRFVVQFMCINAIFILVSQSYLSFFFQYLFAFDKLHGMHTHQSQM